MCRSLDTGLVLVMFMTLSMILTVACLLSLVKYEACPVLFKNNTVSQNNERNDKAEVKSIECNKKFSLYFIEDIWFIFVSFQKFWQNILSPIWNF